MEILGIILPFLGIAAFIYWLMQKVHNSGSDMEGNFLEAAQIKRRRENLEKIFGMAEAKGRISAYDVQQELKVSESDASRYLEYLVNLGKLKRIGERGQDVFYQLP